MSGDLEYLGSSTCAICGEPGSMVTVEGLNGYVDACVKHARDAVNDALEEQRWGDLGLVDEYTDEVDGDDDMAEARR